MSADAKCECMLYGIYVWNKYMSACLCFGMPTAKAQTCTHIGFAKPIQPCLLCIVGGEPCGESLVTELRDAVMSCWIYLDRSLGEGGAQ